MTEKIFAMMDAKPSSPLLTRAEHETQAEAQRLRTQIEAALAAVTTRSGDDTDDLDGHAARIERAARDLAVALRELSRERQQQNSHY